MDLDTSFGRWLRARRRALDLTQDDLARRVGCAVVTIKKIEADERRPSLQLAERLADSVQIAADDRAAIIMLARAEPYLDLAPLAAAVAPLHVPQRPSTNLPTPLTQLIGRKPDIAAVRNVLLRGETRLLTLVGPPGIGKTRLSLAVAHDVQAAFGDGASFVALAPISDPALVLATIAQALGVTETVGKQLLAQLTAAFQAQRRLLVLDNFEQVLAAAPQVVELLEACPGVKALITSRAALHVRGERLYAVPPLLLPDLTRLPAPGALARTPAVALFIEHAQVVRPDFKLTAQNAAALAAICVRLDGLPLAIELAATRITQLPADAILARLEQRLNLLTDGPRDLPPRHQTLRAAIAWSYELLGTGEQTLFRRLGVFVGGWTQEAAEAVYAEYGLPILDWGLGEISSDNPKSAIQHIFDGLAMLVDTSLLQRTAGAEGAPRFTMLETIREYALERLEASDEAEQVRRWHAEYYLALVEAAEPHLHGRERNTWLNRLEVEHDNLRAALGWALDGSAVETGARIAIVLAGQQWDGLWSRIGYWSEGWRWLAAVLAQRDALAPGICAWALLHAAAYRGMLDGNPFLAQKAVLDEALALFRATGDRSGVAYVRCYQGINAGREGDSRAIQILDEALALYQELGDHYHRTTVLYHLGTLALDQGDAARAVVLLEQSLALCRERGYVKETVLVLNALGDVACNQGDLPRATALYWEALLLVEDERSYDIVPPLSNLARLALVQGDDGRVRALLEQRAGWFREKAALSVLIGLIPVLGALVNTHGDSAKATAILRDGVMLQQQFAEQDVMVDSLEAFAGVAVGQGWAVRAARLLGAAEALWIMIGVRQCSSAGPAYRRDVAAARTQLGEEAFAAAWAAGQALTLEQAVAYALEAAPAEITVVDSAA